MQKTNLLILTLFTSIILYGQQIETVYLNAKDSTANMYIAVVPENDQTGAGLRPVSALLILH